MVDNNIYARISQFCENSRQSFALQQELHVQIKIGQPGKKLPKVGTVNIREVTLAKPNQSNANNPIGFHASQGVAIDRWQYYYCAPQSRMLSQFGQRVFVVVTVKAVRCNDAKWNMMRIKCGEIRLNWRRLLRPGPGVFVQRHPVIKDMSVCIDDRILDDVSLHTDCFTSELAARQTTALRLNKAMVIRPPQDAHGIDHALRRCE